MKVMMYTDGSTKGNPGPGGYGTILSCTVNGKTNEKELSGGFLETTNNRMELMAVIAGFEALTKPCEVTVTSDSQYVVKAFTDHWLSGWIRKGWRTSNGPVKNRDLWERLLAAAEPHKAEFVWIKGHTGHPQNERCDALAVAAACGENLAVDEGYLASVQGTASDDGYEQMTLPWE